MWALLLLTGVLGVAAEEGPQLWRVEAGAHHVTLRSLADEGHVDVWSSQHDHSKVLVEAEAAGRVRRALGAAGVGHTVEVPDVLHLVEQERRYMQHQTRHRRAVEQMDWTTYHDLEDIEGFLVWMNATGGRWVQLATAATTDEGRPVTVIRITDPNSPPEQKKKIWIEGGIHAREWISPAVTTYLTYRLVTDPGWRELLKVTDWYLVPVSNPDGYAYSFSSPRARLWRKNRRENNQDGTCKGVDLNRNWNLKWGVGASNYPCSETYKGPVAFSEPETRGLQLMMSQVGDIDLFITFHSFGQTVLYPWGWTRSAPANARQLKRLARKFSDTVKASSRGDVAYSIGGSGPLYGLASGATDDWAYGVLGVPYSYTIELPDEGRHGFLLPENRVSSTVLQSSQGVHCMVSYLVGEGPCSRRRARNTRISQDPVHVAPLSSWASTSSHSQWASLLPLFLGAMWILK